jgi:phospholipase/carboxylesterase
MTCTVDPHRSTPLHREGRSPGETRLAALLVHGRGQETPDIVDVADRVALPDLHHALPAAAGNTWHPGRCTGPAETDEPERTVLIGFSQGTCVRAEHLVRRPRPHAAVALPTGGHLGPDEARTPVGGLQAVRALPDSAGR